MEDHSRPRQIRASHLARRAAVYIRQSSEIQVRDNQGSTLHQREQVRFPKAWGWASDMIDEIDEDLGKSATTTIHRRGYRRMLESIMSGAIGAIFVGDLNRLCRNFRDAAMLLDECRIHDVLLVVDGRVYDLRDRADRMSANMVLSVAEFENDGRRDTLVNGRLAKAAKGITVSQPPAGYVATKGKWTKDPDERVRAAVRVTFDLILQYRSLVRAVKEMVLRGIMLPRRIGLDIRWAAPDVGKLSFLARNRAYVGDYPFRQKRVDPALGRRGNGRLRERPARPDEIVLVRDNHEPYISRDEWDEIQHLLDVNAPKRDRRNLGPGVAVLQGIIRCERHGGSMSPRVKKGPNGTRYSYYACPGARLRGGEPCVVVSGPPLERAVVTQIFERFTPPSIESVRDAWRRGRQAAVDQHRQGELELDRLRSRVKDLKWRLEHVDPANRRVAATLEADLEEALRMLEGAANLGRLREEPLGTFTEKTFAEMISLCADLPRLWHAKTTESHDRKEIVRTVIAQIAVESVTPEQLHARICWADGSRDTPIVVRRPEFGLRLISEMAAAGDNFASITDRLNALGLRRRDGGLWTAKQVGLAVARARRKRQG